MAFVWRICRWKEVYEHDRQAEAARLYWLGLPISLNHSLYRQILNHPNGERHLSAWWSTLMVAAQQFPRERRGELWQAVDAKRDIPRPHDYASLALDIGFAEATVREMMNRVMAMKLVEERLLILGVDMPDPAKNPGLFAGAENGNGYGHNYKRLDAALKLLGNKPVLMLLRRNREKIQEAIERTNEQVVAECLEQAATFPEGHKDRTLQWACTEAARIASGFGGNGAKKIGEQKRMEYF